MNVHVDFSASSTNVELTSSQLGVQTEQLASIVHHDDMTINVYTNPHDSVDVRSDQQIVRTGGTDFPSGGLAGDLLAKRTNADGDVEWITPANSPEEDNTRPITAAAVYTEIGNINALLRTI